MKSGYMRSYIHGMRKAIPVFFGFLPVAVTFAIMAQGANMGVAETVAMSLLVFAGASQIMAVGMIGAGASAVSIIIATLVLNFRHIIMSTCVFKRIKTKNVPLRMLAAFGVTDESFAIITTEDEKNCNTAFMLGIITVTYSSWVGGTLVGSLASNLLPRLVADSFGIALYALFIALIVPDVRKSLGLFLIVLITAMINIALIYVFKFDKSWAIIISTLLGAFVGTFIVGGKEGKVSEE